VPAADRRVAFAQAVAQAELEGVHPELPGDMVDVDLADVRRERIALPLLRDERPELQARELERIISERAGLASDSTGQDGARPGLNVTSAPRSSPSRQERRRGTRGREGAQ